LLLVVVFLVFSWSLPADDDPQALVRDMRAPNHENWQKAHALAALLRHPRNELLRQNATLCRELASILDEQLRAGHDSPSQTRFRVFLCRALGEFQVPDGLPSLLEAAEVSHRLGHVDVHCASLEALAVLAGNVGSDVLRRDARTMSVLLEASGAASDAGARVNRDRVAATATFTLGVVGGPTAMARLSQLLDDGRPAVRYNAATGLARHGDAASTPVLLEMLDADNNASLDYPRDEARSARDRELVVSNALRAAQRLVTANPQADRRALGDALERLRTAPALPARLRSALQAVQAEIRDEAGCTGGGGGL
jgi:HEAT repeat protein